jgi:hypothetical protein
VKITISSPKETLVAFIRATLLREFCIDQASRARSLRTKWVNPSLAEKPKVGKLQMDWLRSEDLKEEKNVTASTIMIAALPLRRRQEAGRRQGRSFMALTCKRLQWRLPSVRILVRLARRLAVHACL